MKTCSKCKLKVDKTFKYKGMVLCEGCYKGVNKSNNSFSIIRPFARFLKGR